MQHSHRAGGRLQAHGKTTTIGSSSEHGHPPTFPRLLLVSEAAAIARCSPHAIWTAIRRGDLTPKYVRPIRLTESEVARWLEEEYTP